MNYKLFEDVIRKLELNNYIYALKKIYESNPVSDDVLILLSKLDFSKIQNKYAYFKKCYLNFNEENILAYKLALYLKDHQVILDINSCVKIFTDNIKKIGENNFLIAFNYSYKKLIQLEDIINKRDAYFIKTLKNNLEKVDCLVYKDEEITNIKKEYNL